MVTTWHLHIFLHSALRLVKGSCSIPLASCSEVLHYKVSPRARMERLLLLEQWRAELPVATTCSALRSRSAPVPIACPSCQTRRLLVFWPNRTPSVQNVLASHYTPFGSASICSTQPFRCPRSTQRWRVGNVVCAAGVVSSIVVSSSCLGLSSDSCLPSRRITTYSSNDLTSGVPSSTTSPARYCTLPPCKLVFSAPGATFLNLAIKSLNTGFPASCPSS